jgi:hypothetical protein
MRYLCGRFRLAIPTKHSSLRVIGKAQHQGVAHPSTQYDNDAIYPTKNVARKDQINSTQCARCRLTGGAKECPIGHGA